MAVSLQPVNRSNFVAVAAIKITSEQALVNPPTLNPSYSIARITVKLDGEKYDYFPRAIYQDDTLVGYMLLVCNLADSEDQWICDFMIDYRFQRQGFGSAALKLAIAWFTEHARATRVRLLCELENDSARKFYEQAGFKNFVRATRLFSLKILKTTNDHAITVRPQSGDDPTTP